MPDTPTPAFGVKHETTSDELRAERILVNWLEIHTGIYGLSVNTETWFDNERSCAVAHLQAERGGEPYTVIAIVYTADDDQFYAWSRQAEGGPITDSESLAIENLGDAIDKAVAVYTAKH